MNEPTIHDTEADIRDETSALATMLIGKNRSYGDSALTPLRCFSKCDSVEQIKVRIDDKLSRIMRGKQTDAFPEDVVLDLLGYFILLRIAEKRRRVVADHEQEEAFIAKRTTPSAIAGIPCDTGRDGVAIPRGEKAYTGHFRTPLPAHT